MCRFSEEKKLEVWNKALAVEGYDSSLYRQDPCGAWIMYDKYNDRESDFGWEIDHVYPQAKLNERGAMPEEIDDIQNLRPMNWRNNVSKGLDFPVYKSCVTAKENKNVTKEDEYHVNEELERQLKLLYSKYL